MSLTVDRFSHDTKDLKCITRINHIDMSILNWAQKHRMTGEDTD